MARSIAPNWARAGVAIASAISASASFFIGLGPFLHGHPLSRLSGRGQRRRHLHFEDRDRTRLAFHHDVSKGTDVVAPFEPGARRVADDNAGLVVLVQ